MYSVVARQKTEPCPTTTTSHFLPILPSWSQISFSREVLLLLAGGLFVGLSLWALFSSSKNRLGTKRRRLASSGIWGRIHKGSWKDVILDDEWQMTNNRYLLSGLGVLESSFFHKTWLSSCQLRLIVEVVVSFICTTTASYVGRNAASLSPQFKKTARRMQPAVESSKECNKASKLALVSSVTRNRKNVWETCDED